MYYRTCLRSKVVLSAVLKASLFVLWSDGKNARCTLWGFRLQYLEWPLPYCLILHYNTV